MRKAHVGEFVRLDGSHHAWFEGRGPVCVLMVYIDDASSRVFARFYDYEGTIPAMDSFHRYMRQRPSHNPDISTLGEGGHFYCGLT